MEICAEKRVDEKANQVTRTVVCFPAVKSPGRQRDPYPR
jgi:hypothetical protein